MRHPKRRGPIARFFVILGRLVKRPLKILGRMISGGNGWKGTAKALSLVALIGTIGIGLIGIITVAIFSRGLPDPQKLIDRQVAQSTKIYDRTGETLLYEIAGEQKRTLIQLDELPDYVPQAVIALEDKTFYEHSGFNFRRLIYAVVSNLIGQKGPGASTLTSQLVKNAILTPERTYTRKIKEMILVFQIERKFEKDQILQLYLNEIPYGSTAYGVEAASNYYFGKSARDLTLGEAALLAAIIQRPTYYSPYGSNLESLLARKDVTLDLMEEQGYISAEERDDAKEQELVFEERREDITAPHFVFYIREQLVEKYGDHMVNQGGLVVRTTLDMEKQQVAEEVMGENRERNLGHNASNAALVSLDPKTGEILSMVGSYDYFDDEIDGQVNVVTRPRQPGSSMKPLVYTLAWMRGYTPSTMVFDVVTQFPATGKAYEPKNYDLSERGPVSFRKALQGSLNIPAVKALYLVGVENFLDFAQDLGYSTFEDRSRFGLSLVLGGGEVTLLDHTAAYATLAAEGEYRKPFGILEVQTNDGAVLDTFDSEPRRVMDENIARITSNVLSDNAARAYVFGLNSALQLGARPVAAKTGTTNDYRDAWTVGYTPSLVTGVWGGNNDFTEMSRGAGGSLVAAPIWQKYMQRVLEGTPVESFNAPKIPTSEKAVLSGKGFGTKLVTIDRASEKLATERTPASFREDRLYIDAHSILYYVDKSNPAGPAPTNPAAADPQFEKWEAAVQAWIQARIEASEPIFSDESQDFPDGIELVYGLPPEEEDDLHVQANQPSLTLISPGTDEELETRSIRVEVQASAPRGISRVDYYLDDVFIGTAATAPYTLTASLKTFPNGFYELRAVAYDDIDNSDSAARRIRLQSNESYVKVRWDSPGNGDRFVIGTSLPLRAEIDAEETVNQMTFFAEKNGSPEIVQALLQPNNGLLEVVWTPSNPGQYNLYAKISIEGSGVVTSPGVTVTIEEPPKEEPTESE